jgi:hypothetical protein
MSDVWAARDKKYICTTSNHPCSTNHNMGGAVVFFMHTCSNVALLGITPWGNLMCDFLENTVNIPHAGVGKRGTPSVKSENLIYARTAMLLWVGSILGKYGM